MSAEHQSGAFSLGEKVFLIFCIHSSITFDASIIFGGGSVLQRNGKCGLQWWKGSFSGTVAFLWLSLREALKVLRKTLDVDKRNSKKQEQNRKNIVRGQAVWDKCNIQWGYRICFSAVINHTGGTFGQIW